MIDVMDWATKNVLGKGKFLKQPVVMKAKFLSRRAEKPKIGVMMELCPGTMKPGGQSCIKC